VLQLQISLDGKDPGKARRVRRVGKLAALGKSQNESNHPKKSEVKQTAQVESQRQNVVHPSRRGTSTSAQASRPSRVSCMMLKTVDSDLPLHQGESVAMTKAVVLLPQNVGLLSKHGTNTIRLVIHHTKATLTSMIQTESKTVDRSIEIALCMSSTRLLLETNRQCIVPSETVGIPKRKQALLWVLRKSHLVDTSKNTRGQMDLTTRTTHSISRLEMLEMAMYLQRQGREGRGERDHRRNHDHDQGQGERMKMSIYRSMLRNHQHPLKRDVNPRL
ncbi:MAG: hypothetical protein Q9183_007258, partial [Haloplaca sp. 2 TL-2023]